MREYDGKRVVITGGTSGIGLAAAKLLLDYVARVMVTGRTQTTLDSARKELGTNAIAVKSDAASLSDIDELAARVKPEFGTLDALLFCAGQTHFAPFEDTTETIFDQLLASNTKGAYFTVQNWLR